MFLTFLLILPCQAFAQFRLTLQQAVDSALIRNLQVKQAKLMAASSEENLKQAKANLLPTLSASPQASVNWGRSLDVSTYNYTTQRILLTNGSLGTQVVLFQGGQLRRQILENKLLLAADRTNVDKVRYDLILSVTTVFLQILASQDLWKAAGQQIQLAQLNIEKVQKEFDAGNKSLADLAQAKAQKSVTEVDAINIQNQLETSMIELQQLMQMQGTALELVGPNKADMGNDNIKVDTASLLKAAIDVNPTLKVVQLQTQAFYQAVKVAQSGRYPSINLFGSIGSNFSNNRSIVTGSNLAGYDTIGRVSGSNQQVVAPVYNYTYKNYGFTRQIADNFYQSAGIMLSIPIFNRLNNQINIRKAKIAYQNAEISTQIAINNLSKVINQALADLRASYKRLVAAKSNLEASQQVLFISEKRYMAGLINSLDYNTALNNRNKAQFSVIQAEYDLLFRDKVIDYYRGKDLKL